MFADDTSCLCEGNNIDQLVNYVNNEMQKISNWLTINKLALNISKTKYIIFRTKGKRLPDNLPLVTINTNKIGDTQSAEYIFLLTRVYNNAISIEDRSYKLLGVYFDEYLTFDKHTDIICSKLSRANFCLRRVANKVPEKQLKNLYHALFHPHLLYCLNITCCTSKTNINRIVCLQKKAIRIVNKAQYNAHTAPLFKYCNILPFNEQIMYQNLTFMHSLFYNYAPRSFSNSTRRNETNENDYNLRNQNIMYVPRARIDQFKRLPIYNLPNLWNMAGDLIHYSNPITFSVALKLQLFENLN
jgi:hypothetical protein